MFYNLFHRSKVPLLGMLATLLAFVIGITLFTSAQSADTPDPGSVTIVGDLQTGLGCPNVWDPTCTDSSLAYDGDDTVWQGIFTVPAGVWQYKVALNGSWTENYGDHAQRDGSNIPLSLGAATNVKFYYDHETHWITSDQNSVIAVAPGSFQSELGCPGDWQADCLRSWLQDPDGDGIYTFQTTALPAGSYEVKVALNESWNVNYGAGGVQNGANIPFSVPNDCSGILFSYDSTTHLLTVTPASAPTQPEPAAVVIPGSFQQEVGCSNDWQPDCAATGLDYDPVDGVWQGIFDIPAGAWEYKATLNNSWDENYGLNATRNGPNIGLNLASNQEVKFYYSHQTHWVTDQTKVIAVAPGSFQSELGCPGDWQPDCLRSWLQDPDGDGIYTFSTSVLPAGSYEVKVALNESWNVNYGAGGVQNGANISFSVPAACRETFFSYDSSTHVLTVSAAGAPAGNIRLAQAYWVSQDTIAWKPGAILPGDLYQLHSDPEGGLALDTTGVVGGSAVPLAYDEAGLGADILAKFPHLAGYSAFKIGAADLAAVPEILKGQVAVSALRADGTPFNATSLQIQGVLDDLYIYTGPLGITFSGEVPSLSLWAPTAKSVKVHVFDDANPTTVGTVLSMSPDPSTGVWSITGEADWDRKFYLYEVEVYVHSTGRIEHNLVTDPYSLSLSANSSRSQIVNLDDADLKPASWDTLVNPPLNAFEDIVLYELHTRDFSSADPSVPAAYQGTYKAFTNLAYNGMQHLADLAVAGLTHIHLLPSFDIASVDEDRATWQEPAGDLASFPPDSTEQQARVMAVADQDGFNWGYDPWHFTTPEGSYATDTGGVTRILEFREMVAGLNQAGLRVVMDVVYNHTTASGQNNHSVLDKIVPGYYHRLNADGNVETSTCCQNTASEFAMMEKLMIDSALTWVKYYGVDGFRFDLMGHHTKENMLNLRAALDALTVENNGVDGSEVYLYGEGWNFGEVANNARFIQATQLNMAGTGIGSFNDRLRDGVRGGGPFSGLQEQGFITGLYYDPNATDQGSGADQLNTLLHRTDWIRVGLAGNLSSYELVDQFGNLVTAAQVDYNGQPAGYTADPQENIIYIEAHDNETLFDALQAKTPVSTSMADRVRIQNLGNSIVLLSQGVPFFQAGQDLLRSKSLDRNSYNSGDWFNALDWTLQTTNWGRGLPPAGDNQSNWPVIQPLLADPALDPGPADIQRAADHFQEMLRIRMSSPLFRLQTADEVMANLSFYNTGADQIPGLIVMSLTDETGDIDRPVKAVMVLFNANDEPQAVIVPAAAGLDYRLHPVLQNSTDPVVRSAGFDSTSGTFSVPARTTAVFVYMRPAVEQLNLLKNDVQELVDAHVLNSGQGNSLLSKLNTALSRLAKGNDAAGINALQSFIHQVDDYEATGVLTSAQAEALRKAAQDAILAVQNE